MTQERKNQFIEVAFKNEETAAKLMALEPAEVVAALKAEGYDFTLEEVAAIGEEIKAVKAQAAQNELSEGDLEAVAGGKGEFVAGVVVGMWIGVAFLGGW